MVNINRFAIALLLCCCFLTVGTAMGQGLNANWVTGATAEAFWDQLQHSPYTQNGSRGLTVYMLSYSECGNCIEFLRDFWEPRKDSMQLREIFAPVNQSKFLDQAADMALTRDPARANAYYHRTLVAPRVNSSPDRQAALRAVVDFNTRANSFFAHLGHVQDSYPTFIFRVPDGKGYKLFIVSGFGPDFASDLSRWVADASQNAGQ